LTCIEKQKLPYGTRRAVGYSVFRSGLYRFGNHILEQDFERHGVSAALVGKEKFAIAVKNTIIVGNMVIVIIAMESKVELVEVKTLPVFSVSLCLFQLAD
jgi:hypothetical protein